MLDERSRDGLRESLAIDRERGAGGHATRFRRAHHERTKAPHFLFQQTDGIIELVAAKRIAADELRQPIRLVHRGRTRRPHLIERHGYAARRRLPCGLGTGEPASDDSDTHQWTVLRPDGFRFASARVTPAAAGTASVAAAAALGTRR